MTAYSAIEPTTAAASSSSDDVVVTITDNNKNDTIVVLSVEDYHKVQKMRQLQKSGVPEEAVMARCKHEQIEYDWLLRQPENITVVNVNSNTNKQEDTTASLLFRLNTGDGNVDFIEMKAPLTALVKIFLPSVQRRGQLDMKTGTGTYLSVPLVDLQNALGSFRAVQYDRDLYISTLETNQNNNNIHDDDTDDDTDTDTVVRCKRRRFQQHLISIGMSSRIQQQPNEIKRDTIIPGLDELIQFVQSSINNHNKDNDNSRNDNDNSNMFTYHDLGTMYSPGTKCLAKDAVTTGVPCLVQVVWSRYEQGKTLGGIVRRFVVAFQFVCAVQNHFGIAEFTESMIEFEHSRRIDTLPYIPLLRDGAGGTSTAILAEARARGKLYQNIAIGSHFMGYRKGSFYPKGIANHGGSGRSASSASSFSAASKMDGRVMVDIMGSYEVGHSVSTGYDGMVLAIHEKSKEFMVYLRQQRSSKPRSTSIDHHANTAPSASSSVSDSDGPLIMKTIPKYLLELTWPAVTGFSFTSKSWGDILVEGLFEIEFAEATFDQLVLPPSRKRMIKALVRHSSDSFHDIISGKGEGSVFLLYGPPGVGKTLTAEAISEMLHRPLYSVSLGQLGITPAELETKLGEILELCSKWDALILLDEADIFLEKRTNGGSLERNAMVSVMLRLVEYFKGVLFLTSNRVDSLDPAFKTRITLALRYEPLDKEARNQVWRNLLEASGQIALIESCVIRTDELASKVLNGREIKNSIRLALALAAEDGTPLTQEVLVETLELVFDFNEKLNAADAY